MWHLMGSAGCGAARLKSQSVNGPHATESRRHLLPPSGVAPLGSSVRPPVRRVLLGYAGLNSVPCRSMACMMMASRRASAIRALRIVDRLAIANAQSLSFSGPLVARQHDICGFVQECANPPVATLGDAAGVVNLAGLIAPRHQTEISANVAGSPEAFGIIDCRCEGRARSVGRHRGCSSAGGKRRMP